jgi:mitogen-activated protein kinase 1/3
MKKDRKVAIKKVINAFEDLIDGKRILREIRLLSKIQNI